MAQEKQINSQNPTCSSYGRNVGLGGQPCVSAFPRAAAAEPASGWEGCAPVRCCVPQPTPNQQILWAYG